MATAAETWMKQGEARGLAEGMARGEAKGKAETLLRLMERRFGTVPEAVRARVSAAPIADLDGWIDAILDARDIDGVSVEEAG